jgi:hypothetical protein
MSDRLGRRSVHRMLNGNVTDELHLNNPDLYDLPVGAEIESAEAYWEAIVPEARAMNRVDLEVAGSNARQRLIFLNKGRTQDLQAFARDPHAERTYVVAGDRSKVSAPLERAARCWRMDAQVDSTPANSPISGST